MPAWRWMAALAEQWLSLYALYCCCRMLALLCALGLRDTTTYMAIALITGMTPDICITRVLFCSTTVLSKSTTTLEPA